MNSFFQCPRTVYHFGSFSFCFPYSIHVVDSKYNGELQSNKNPKDHRFQILKGLAIVLLCISSEEIKAQLKAFGEIFNMVFSHPVWAPFKTSVLALPVCNCASVPPLPPRRKDGCVGKRLILLSSSGSVLCTRPPDGRCVKRDEISLGI